MSSTQRCKSTCLCNKRLLLEKQATRGTVGFLCIQKSKPTALSEPICHPIKQSAQEAGSPLRTWTGQSRGQPVNIVPLCISTPCRSTRRQKNRSLITPPVAFAFTLPSDTSKLRLCRCWVGIVPLPDPVPGLPPDVLCRRCSCPAPHKLRGKGV